MGGADKCLGVLAKFWQPGRVKTRLAEGIGPEAASRLYQAFVSTLMARFAHLADQRWLCFWPPERRDAFAAVGGGWQLHPQPHGDLGQRLSGILSSALTGGCDRVVLIGSDSPTLPVEFVALGLERLADHEVVLGPTDDGGYYLVGARREVSSIFEDISWSTPLVWEQTLARVQAAGLSYAQLPQWYDVDEPADFERLRTELSECDLTDAALRKLAAVVNQIV